MAKKGSKSSNDEPEGFGFPRYLRLPRALLANFPREKERERERFSLSFSLATCAFVPSEL